MRERGSQQVRYYLGVGVTRLEVYDRFRDELQDIADDLQIDADLEQSVRSAYLQERANEAAATYTAVENGAGVFDQGLFVTVRADETDDLRDAV